MKSFREFRDDRKYDALIWECAREFVENDIHPVLFTWEFFKEQVIYEADPARQSAMMEVISHEEEILGEMYIEGLLSRLKQGYSNKAAPLKGGSMDGKAGNWLGKAAGWGAEKLGNVGGWFKRQFKDFGRGFGQGTGGQGYSPAVPGDPASAPGATPDPGTPGGDPAGGDDIQKVAGFLQQAMQVMDSAGFHKSYPEALKKMLDGISAGKHAEDFGGAATSTAPAAAADPMADPQVKSKVEELKQMLAANDQKLQKDITMLGDELQKKGVDLEKVGINISSTQQKPAVDPMAARMSQTTNAHTEYEGEDVFETYTDWLDGYNNAVNRGVFNN